MTEMRRFAVRCMRGVGVTAMLALAACGQNEPAARTAAEIPKAIDSTLREPTVKSVPVAMRRLTEDQYRNIIPDVFGDSIEVAGHFDPLVRTGGLLAVGASMVNMTPAAFERNEIKARGIAAQVLAPSRRDVLVHCTPASVSAPDDACAKQFFQQVGRLLFRRPLTAAEVQINVDIAKETTQKLGNFYSGLERGLAAMLMAPNFFYIVSQVEPDPSNPGASRLDAYSKASRLSFFLWNTTPDDILLAAAERGELHTDRGLRRQIDRMLASPRLKNGVRAFFTDMFAFGNFDTLTKDNTIYPAFSQAVAHDAKEQTLLTVVDVLVTKHGDYRDIFTTRDTFLSAPLGLVYRLPVSKIDGTWVPYEFPEGDPRIGVIPQISFVAMHSHTGQSSPTLRGRAIREILMCQRVPDPPANVDFDLFNSAHSAGKTARDRLNAHSVNPVCGGCHKITDPLGLALENFDGLGQFRMTENNVPINTTGALDGKKFDGAAGLAQAISEHPATTSCLVNRLYSYATGRATGPENRELVAYLQKSFVADGYRLPELMRRIATSKAFYAAAAQDGANAAPGKSAGNTVSERENKL